MGVSQYWGPPHHWTPPHHEIPNSGNDWLWSHLSNTNVKTLLYKTLTAKRCRKAEPYFGLWQGFSRGLRAGQRAKYRGGRAATAPLGDAWCGRMADKNERRKGTIRNILEHLKMVTLKMALLQSECVFQTYFRGIPGLFVVEGSMEAVVVVSCNNYSWNIQVNLEIAKQSDVKAKNGDPVKT